MNTNSAGSLWKLLAVIALVTIMVVGCNAQSSHCKTGIQWHKNAIGLNNNDGISPDGRLRVSSRPDGSIALDNLIFDPTPEQQKIPNMLSGHAAAVNAIAFSPDGKTLASSGEDRKIKLWDLDTGRLLLTLSTPNSKAQILVFNPAGKLLASGSTDNIIQLWDLESGKLRQTLSQPTGIQLLIFSPDGKVLASGSKNNTVIWNTQTGELLRTLSGHKQEVLSLAFSPDSKMLASGGKDNQVILWDWESGKLVRSLAASDPHTLLISADGTLLESLADETTLQWELKTGKQICNLTSQDR